MVRDNQTAELRPVTIKTTEGNDVAIATGLQAGEMVVLEGMDKVQDGARVDVQTPGQAADVASGGTKGGNRPPLQSRGGRGERRQ